MIKLKAKKNQVRSFLLVLLAGMLAMGCSTYEQKNKVITYWRQGNLPAATTEAQKMADSHTDDKDTIVWRLEQGAVLRASRQYEDSNKAFEAAQNKMERYAEAAKVRVGNEAGALLSNQANLPYEGRSYDGIMLNTYEALNYLALGKIDQARPELIHAYQRQQDAVEANKKRIQKVQDEAAKSKDKAVMDRAQDNSGFQDALATNNANLNDLNLKAYANYVNPFTVYLNGLYFMVNAADDSDRERARTSLERVKGFGDNEYIKQDLATLDDEMNGKPQPPTTYVIFETGCAPERGQVRIDIPIIISRVSYVGAAFPTLKMQNSYVPTLTVTGGGTNLTTAMLASMDSIIGLDFKNEMPVVITKTVAATVTKAVAAYAINDAANQQSAIGGLIAQIGTAAYQAAVNIADTRTWTTLPKQFQYCRFPTPADRKLTLSAPGMQNSTVTIGDGVINVVYVKSIDRNVPMIVTQMKLK